MAASYALEREIMAQNVVLLILLAWLVITAIMTLMSGRPAREQPRRRAERQTPPPQTPAPNPDFQDPALASRP
jgi:hypothetical protein